MKKKLVKQPRFADIDNYKPPKYAVQPADNDTGFFMVKKAFDAIKNPKSKRFSAGVWF